MRIEIICTGDEVLSGKTVNTNYSHMARRLQEVGLDVLWGTTVGDERASLVEAFHLAAKRADAVIVIGGLGPTVDDLSQEVAAEAAGVSLELDRGWLEHIEGFYASRGREMPPNNRKQAMLPAGSELIDNPIGTACGFALDIGQARFMFTPGVPREIQLMLEEQLIPRLLNMGGVRDVVRLKRFHSFGLGESRVDNMLSGIEGLATDGEVKLGFQAHYPQLETKLFARAADHAALDALLAPVEEAVRTKLGAYLLAEDDDTLEETILRELSVLNGTLAVAECGTDGKIASRLVGADRDGNVFQRGVLAASVSTLGNSCALEIQDTPNLKTVSVLAEAVRQVAGTTHGLAVRVVPENTPGEGLIFIGISHGGTAPLTRKACIVGGPERVRGGGVEMGLDCIRRLLKSVSVDDSVDFEKRP